MMHPGWALLLGIIIVILFFAIGAFSGSQSDIDYWSGEDAGQSMDTVNDGYETTSDTGGDIGVSDTINDFEAEGL